MSPPPPLQAIAGYLNSPLVRLDGFHTPECFVLHDLPQCVFRIEGGLVHLAAYFEGQFFFLVFDKFGHIPGFSEMGGGMGGFNPEGKSPLPPSGFQNSNTPLHQLEFLPPPPQWSIPPL